MVRQALAVGCLSLAVAACSSSTGAQHTTTSPSGGTPTVSTSAPTTAIRPDVDVALDRDDAPQNPYFAFGSVWVSAHHAGEVLRLNAQTGKVIARIDTGSQPGGIVAGPDRVWVVHYGGTQKLVGIDPKSNKVVAKIALPGEACCQPAVLGSTVWVAASDGSASSGPPGIIAVDAATGKIGERVAGVDGPVAVNGQLWASRQGRLVKVDTKTGTATALPAGSGSVLWAAPPAQGLTWAAGSGALALGLGADGAVSRTIALPPAAASGSHEGMAVTSRDTVWATDATGTHVWRIDPGATEPVLVAELPATDTLTICGDGKGGVWVALFERAHMQHYPGATSG